VLINRRAASDYRPLPLISLHVSLSLSPEKLLAGVEPAAMHSEVSLLDASFPRGSDSPHVREIERREEVVRNANSRLYISPRYKYRCSLFLSLSLSHRS